MEVSTCLRSGLSVDLEVNDMRTRLTVPRRTTSIVSSCRRISKSISRGMVVKVAICLGLGFVPSGCCGEVTATVTPGNGRLARRQDLSGFDGWTEESLPDKRLCYFVPVTQA